MRRVEKTLRQQARDSVNGPLMLLVIALLAYGSVMVSSATAGMTGGPGLFRRHLIGIVIGLVPMVVAWAIDYKKLKHWTGPLLILFAFLLISPRIPGLGTTAKSPRVSPPSGRSSST